MNNTDNNIGSSCSVAYVSTSQLDSGFTNFALNIVFIKPLYTPSVIKNTSNAPNTDTLNTKQKSPFYFLCILLCILFSLLHKITSKITHIPIDLTL